MYRKRREELLIKSRIDGDKKAEVIREQQKRIVAVQFSGADQAVVEGIHQAIDERAQEVA